MDEISNTIKLLKWLKFILKQKTSGKFNGTDDEFIHMVDEEMFRYLRPKTKIGVLGIV